MVLDITDYKNGVREYTLDEARRLTERIRILAHSVADSMEKLRGLVEDAKAGNVHEQLGYASWTAYLADALGDTPMRLERDARQEMSQMLTDEGMSTRAAAKVLGVSNYTVSTDVAGVSSLTPEPVEIEADPITGEVIEPAPTVATTVGVVIAEQRHVTPEPRTITGLDGKTYTQKPRSVEATVTDSAPKRRPITDQFFEATFDLGKNIQRLERLAEDDRLPANKEKVASKNLNDLLRTQDALARVIESLK